MTPTHPKWSEFTERLGGPEGCNFSESGEYWDCDHDFSRSEKVLAAMGFSPAAIGKSQDYFIENGGTCDCEILLNVQE